MSAQATYFVAIATVASAWACSSAPEEAGEASGGVANGGSAGSAAGMPSGGTASGGTASGGTAGTPAGGASGSAGSGPAGGSAQGGSAAGGSAGASGSAGAPPSEYWVGPNGSDNSNGTEATPFLTLNRANQFARAGSTIWVLPGTLMYATTMDLTQYGTAAAPIRVWATAGARPVIDFSGQPRATSSRGIELSGNFWHLRGLEIRNAGDNGILISGSDNVIEDVITHHNGDTGIQITVSEAQATLPNYGANNTVLNCDSYENFDMATNGENADGFAAKLRIGPGNVFRGCRAWNNADDGYDFFAADDVVVVEDSWAFLNGRVAGGGNSAGDGNGFKLGGEPNGPGQGHAAHRLTRVAAFENRSCGFTRNNNDQSPVLASCAVAANGNDYCDDLATCSPESGVSVSGNEARTLPRGADGSLPGID